MGIDTYVPKKMVQKVAIPAEPIPEPVIEKTTRAETEKVQPVLPNGSVNQQISKPVMPTNEGCFSWLKAPAANGLLVVFAHQGVNLDTEARGLLSNMLKAIDYQPQDTGYAVIDKPGAEADVSLADVKGIVVLGKAAGDSMVLSAGARKVPGEDYFQVDNIPVVVTLHPAEIIETPALKARAWSDLKLIARLLSM
jgi:hypothetical protein